MKVHGTTGNAVAVFVQNDGIEDIAAARYDAAAAVWRGMRTLYTGTYKGQRNGVGAPQIGMDRAGNAVAVWAEGATRSLHYATYRAADNTWSASAVLHAGAAFYFVHPVVATDPSGNVFVQWMEGDNQQVMVKRYNAANRTWSASIPLASNAGMQTARLAVDPQGNAMAVWLRASDGVVQFSRFSPSTGQWSAPAAAGRSALSATPQIVLDNNGNGTALWTVTPAGGNEFSSRIVAARYTASTNSWSAARAIQTSNGSVLAPELAVDGKNNVFVTWSQATDYSTPNALYAVRFNAASNSWSAPVKLRGGSFNQIWPRIAADSQGNAVIVWSQMVRYDEMTGDRFFNKASIRFNVATNAWGAARIDSKIIAEAYGFGVGMGPNGRALTLFQQDSGYRWYGSMIYGVRANMLMLAQ